MSSSKLKIKIVAFTVDEEGLKLFLKQVNSDEFFLPWGRLEEGDPLEVTVRRVIKENLGFSPKDEYIEQLYTFSKIRDSNTYIDIVYYILIPYQRVVKDRLNEFLDVREALLKTEEDKKIIRYALQRLAWKLEYTNVVYSLIPAEFTLSELQTTYEAIFGKKLDKRNFRKKIMSLKLLKNTGKKRRGEVARPATLYCFRQKTPVIVKVFS